MERSLYASLRQAEGSWWYQGRAAAVRTYLSKTQVRQGAALDFGAGYGAMFSVLSEQGPVDACEMFPECLPVLRERGYRTAVGTLPLLPLQERYALIGAFDVLEHIEDDAGAVRELLSKLSPGGVLVATVPAHAFLWSEHDVENHHVRRYSMAEFRRLLEENGFLIERLSYWNMSLFPVAVLLRLFGTGGKEGLAPATPINLTLSLVVRIEAFLLRFMSLPFGLSIIVTARKKTS